MPKKLLLLDERQLHFLIPAHHAEAVRIRRKINSRRFQSALLKDLRAVLEQFQLRPPVRIRIG